MTGMTERRERTRRRRKPLAVVTNANQPQRTERVYAHSTGPDPVEAPIVEIRCHKATVKVGI